MRRRKNLLRHRMRSNGGNTYKSRGKGVHCRRLMACLGRRMGRHVHAPTLGLSFRRA